MPLFKFSVAVGNKTYQCERFVSGQKEMRQTVTVAGFGRKKDPSLYGDKSQPLSNMTLTARLIAHEIIKEHGN
jgi:hypothetical protein